MVGTWVEHIGGGEKILRAIDWRIQKQKRVYYYAFGAKILAAADVDYRGHDLHFRLVRYSEIVKWCVNIT